MPVAKLLSPRARERLALLEGSEFSTLFCPDFLRVLKRAAAEDSEDLTGMLVRAIEAAHRERRGPPGLRLVPRDS